jgi:hypothetical protein
MSAAPATAVQLAGIEAVRLLRNRAMWLAVGLAALIVRQNDGENAMHFLLVGYGVMLPGLVLLIASAFAVRRDRSSGATELMATTPTDRGTRTAAHGLAGLAGGALALVVTASFWLYGARDSTLGMSDETMPQLAIPRPNLAQFLQGPFVVVALCALGVLLGRLLPSWLVVVALIVPAMVQFLFLGLWNGQVTSASNWWFPLSSGWVTGEWLGCGNEAPVCVLKLGGFDRTTPWWHLAYLATLAAFLVLAAVVRDRRDRATLAMWALAAGAVIALAAIQASVYTRFTPIGG